MLLSERGQSGVTIPDGIERRWHPVLEPHERGQAVAIAQEVAGRLRECSMVERAADLARQQTAYPRTVTWRPVSASQGYAGLALACGAFDDSFPGAGWDLVAREHLRRAVAAAERLQRATFGMYSGLGGLAYAAWYLSRQGARYRRLLSTLDAAVLRLSTAATTALARDPPHGVGVSTFDVISGLSGIGRYLLLRQEGRAHAAALEQVLRCLVALSREVDDLPRWHTPNRFMADEASRRQCPHGNLNCGLAHGIPGPLALLSLTAIQGIVVEGQLDAIRRIVGWLCRHRLRDPWGTNWPAIVPLPAPCSRTGAAAGDLPDGSATATPSRSAWCYGSPGVARALWLAGTALDDEACRRLALDAVAAVHRRPLRARQIDSPTFCHGVAGLQQITLRFANETGAPAMIEAARTLHRQIVAAYEPESLVGFRNVEPGGRRIDQPGLLDGAAGVTLVLLAAAIPVEPRWDALFLLS